LNEKRYHFLLLTSYILLPSFMIPIHVLDFEGSTRTGVVEYGIATLLDGEITTACNRLCASAVAVPGVDTRCHGLRDSDLAGSAPLAADWELFAGLRREGFFCAHHASTEHTLLKTVWPYPGAMPEHTRPGEALNDWGPWIDTYRLALAWHPGLPDYKLESLVSHFALEDELSRVAHEHCSPKRRAYHCALFDALAAALLLRRLCAGQRNAPGEVFPSLELLIRESSTPERQSARDQITFDF
jgi:DNA polymerase-3 subunit epsilon